VPAASRHSSTEARRRRSAPGRTCNACRGSSPGAKPPRPQHKRPWSMNRLGTGANSIGRRQTESRETNRGKKDDSPRSKGRARGGDSFAPRGGSGNRRSLSESHGDAVGDAQSQCAKGGLGLGFHRVSERGLSPTGPCWFDLTRSGGSDQWAQVVRFSFNN
jgi:hypothetical protein